MKKYIMFCYNITGMGGGQQFIFTKVRYLQKNGFNVRVYSTIRDEIVIKPLCEFEPLIMRELKYPPCTFRKRKVSKIVNSILDEIGGINEEIYIESDGGYETQWAEMIAERCECQHICLNVIEAQNNVYSDQFLELFYFKYRRKELYGITDRSLKLIFKDKYEINDSEKFKFSATCTNVVDEYGKFDVGALPRADYNIGGIWRTNKEGFVETFTHILPFLERHQDNIFSIVIIGAGSETNEERVKMMFEKYSNVKLTILGYMYPIPLELIKAMNVFVSTSGSCKVPLKAGVPSISVTTGIDLVTGKRKYFPLGILNYTTRRAVVPENSGYTLQRLLEMVLYENWCSAHSTLGMELEEFDENLELERELQLFGHETSAYFPVNKITAETKIEKGYALFGKMFGALILFKVDRLSHVIKEKMMKGKR